MTDSVYVSVGAVEADRLDKVSDRPGKIYGGSGFGVGEGWNRRLTFTLWFYESG